MVRVVMDTVKRTRGKGEYRMVPRASALGVEIVGDGAIMSRLLEELLAAGKIAREDALTCVRGEMSVFAKGTTVSEFVVDPSRAKAWKPWEARQKTA